MEPLFQKLGARLTGVLTLSGGRLRVKQTARVLGLVEVIAEAVAIFLDTEIHVLFGGVDLRASSSRLSSTDASFLPQFCDFRAGRADDPLASENPGERAYLRRPPIRGFLLFLLDAGISVRFWRACSSRRSCDLRALLRSSTFPPSTKSRTRSRSSESKTSKRSDH